MRRFLVVCIAALAFAAPAYADQTFSDSANETAGSADISTVTVGNDATAKTVTFKVQIANMPTLENNAAVEMYFDADNNPATGKNGVDCIFGVESGGFYLLKWDGTQFTQVTGLGEQVSYANGLWTSVLHETDCGFGQTFVFWVTSYRGPDVDNPITDDAPDGEGVYTYTLAAAVTPPAAAPATIKGTSVKVNGAPRSGHVLTVGGFAADLSDGTSVLVAGMKCSATLGGKKLAGRGAGGCTFTLPTTAKKKKLVVTVTGRASGTTLRKTLSYVVK